MANSKSNQQSSRASQEEENMDEVSWDAIK
jgi:hypothetical protein